MSIFNSKSIGIDISDNTIEIIELEKKGKNIEIVSKNRKNIAKGII